MGTSLFEYSNQIADLVEAAAPGVVTVSARHGKPATGIAWEDGVVVTSSHAVVDDENATVGDGETKRSATLVGRDNASDLAVLRVEGMNAPAARRGSELRPGELVLALGRPGDLRASVGHVVSTAARQHGWRGGHEGMILSDAHLFEGFSGGPLVNAAGAVVAVNSWFYGRGTTRSLGVESAERIVRSLLAHGRVKKPYLGIGTQPVSLDPQAASAAGQERGLMVIGVEAGSPAASGGVVQGDTLVRIDGAPVGGMRQLFAALQAVEVDSEHTLRVVRAGAIVEVAVTVGERQETPAS